MAEPERTVFENEDGLMLFRVEDGKRKINPVALPPSEPPSEPTISACPVWHQMYAAPTAGPSASRPVGIAWHEDCVVIGDAVNRKLLFLDPLDGTVIKTVSMLGMTTGEVGELAPQGANIWVLERYSGFSAKCRMSLRTTTDAPGVPAGTEVAGFQLDRGSTSYVSVALDPSGNSLWLHDGNFDEMAQWSLTGTKLQVIDIPTPVLNVTWGLAFDNEGFLWATNAETGTVLPEKLVKLDPVTMEVLQICWLSVGTVTGMMYHEGYFWHVSNIPQAVFRGGRGQIIEYEYEITNDGSVPIVDVTLEDDKIGTLLVQTPEIFPGDSVIVGDDPQNGRRTIYEVTDADRAAGFVTNVATVTATTNTTSPTQVTASDSLTVNV